LIDLVWGFNAVFLKIGVDAMPPILFGALRVSLVLLLLFPFLRWKPGEMLAIAGVAVFTLASFALSFIGFHLADASIASVLGQLNAPFATILSIIFLKEQVGWRRWLGISVAFGGSVYLGFDPNVVHYAAGAAFAIAAAFTSSVAQILMRRMGKVGVFELQAWIACIAAPCLFALSFATEKGQGQAITHWNWIIAASLAFNALGASILGHGGMFFLLRRHSVSLVASLFLLAPVFAIGFGVWILHDPMTPRILIGSIMTLVGVLIIALRQRRSPVVAIAPNPDAIEPLPAYSAGAPKVQD
jgi:O-acetylserine/cysteine efflux transporter